MPEPDQQRPFRRAGRPPLPPEVKRARRNARDRAKREARRKAKGTPEIPVSPFAKGFDLLDDLGRTAAGAKPGTGLIVGLSTLHHALTPEQVDKARDISAGLRKYQVTGLAPNSTRSMLADWRQWVAYSLEDGLPVMPVTVDALIPFVTRLQQAGYQRATLEHMVFTLRHLSKLHGCPDPTDHPVYRAFWKDMCRTVLTAAQRQAPGLNLEDLDTMLAAVNPHDPIAVRDAAMVGLLYDGVMRASEVVALTWDQVSTPDAKGGATVLIARSKSDQEGHGREVYISPSLSTYSGFSIDCESLICCVICVCHDGEVDASFERTESETRDNRTVSAACAELGCHPQDVAQIRVVGEERT